ANRLKLLGQVHRAHPPFTYGSKNLIPAEIVITGCRCRCIDGLGDGSIIRTNRTIKCPSDQTPRAQSGGITGTQFLTALSPGWHLEQSRSSYFSPFAREAVTFSPRFLIRVR